MTLLIEKSNKWKDKTRNSEIELSEIKVISTNIKESIHR